MIRRSISVIELRSKFAQPRLWRHFLQTIDKLAHLFVTLVSVYSFAVYIQALSFDTQPVDYLISLSEYSW